MKANYMRPDVLTGVKRVRSKGRTYYYFDTGTVNERGRKIYKRLPDIADDNFAATLAAFMAGRTRRANVAKMVTVARLAELYENSDKFKALSKSSKKTYSIQLRRITEYIGNAPVDNLERRDVVLFMDSLAHQPASANMVLSVISAMYKWGRMRGHVHKHSDPCAEIPSMKMDEHHPWPDHILDAALASDNDRVRLAVHLLYYTAQRIGDVMNIRWSDIQGDRLVIRQQKTGKPLTIPLHHSLRQELDRTPRRGMTIITAQDGRPMGDQRIRIALKEFCASMGAKLVPHGLRKNAVNALIESGCSEHEACAISGQSPVTMRHYAKQRDQQKLSTAAILKWERKA